MNPYLKFCTVINCMDGRTQLPVIDFLKDHFKADFVDSITEPGPIKIISEKTDTALIESMKARLAISIEQHNSVGIACVAHYDCVGNPVGKDRQLEQLGDSIEYIKSLYPGHPVIGLWIGETGNAEIALNDTK
ncbi:MAG: hypothetical protein GF401_13825 [Chitinivibrionales bacterium]|nr:hypothetical protein [Chitinivibrionales bacterium]